LRIRIENSKDTPIVPAPIALETQAQTLGAHRIPLIEARGQILRIRIENSEDTPIVLAPTALEI